MQIKKKQLHYSNLVEDEHILESLELLNKLHSTWRRILLVNDFSRDVSFDCDILNFALDRAQMVPLK